MSKKEKKVFCAMCNTTVDVHFHPEICLELCGECAEMADEDQFQFERGEGIQND